MQRHGLKKACGGITRRTHRLPNPGRPSSNSRPRHCRNPHRRIAGRRNGSRNRRKQDIRVPWSKKFEMVDKYDDMMSQGRLRGAGSGVSSSGSAE